MGKSTSSPATPGQHPTPVSRPQSRSRTVRRVMRWTLLAGVLAGAAAVLWVFLQGGLSFFR